MQHVLSSPFLHTSSHGINFLVQGIYSGFCMFATGLIVCDKRQSTCSYNAKRGGRWTKRTAITWATAFATLGTDIRRSAYLRLFSFPPIRGVTTDVRRTGATVLASLSITRTPPKPVVPTDPMKADAQAAPPRRTAIVLVICTIFRRRKRYRGMGLISFPSLENCLAVQVCEVRTHDSCYFIL